MVRKKLNCPGFRFSNGKRAILFTAFHEIPIADSDIIFYLIETQEWGSSKLG